MAEQRFRQVNVPGIGPVNFPAEMNDEQIAAAIKASTQAQPRPLYTGGKDIAAGVGSGLVRGTAMVAGQGGDIVKAGEAALEGMTAKPVPPDQFGPQQPGATKAQVTDEAIAAAPKWLQPYLRKSAPDLSSARLMQAIDTGANKLIPGVGPVANFQPESRLGSVGQTAASFVPMAAAGRTGLIRGGVAPGAVSEILGQAGEGTKYETPLRIGGAVVGGSVPRPRQLTQADLRAAGSAAFESPAVTGLRVDPGGMPRMAADIQRRIEARGVRPYSADAGPLYRGIDELRNLQPGTPGAGLSIADVRPMKDVFGGQVQKGRDPLTGNLSPEAAGAATARSRVANYLANVPPGDVVAGDAATAGTMLRFGNANWTQAEKMAVAERALELARRRASTGGSGKNVTNVERQEFRKILNNLGQEANLAPEEIAALERAVMGTPFGNKMRDIGNQFGGSGMAANVGSGAVGGGAYYLSGGDAQTAMGAAILARMGGLGARAASEASQMANIRRYEQLLASRSPLAQHPEVMRALGISQVTPQNPSVAALLAAEQTQEPLPPAPLRITVRPPPREPVPDYP